MKIKDGFILRKVADTYAAVPVGDRAAEFSGMITLNKSGAFLWEFLQKDTTEEQILEAVMERYDTDESNASKCLKRFLAGLEQADLLEA